MAQLSHHPAPGLGDILPGWFAVPQNPVIAKQQGITYAPTIGDILPGSYPVPQNPIKDYTKGQVRMIGQAPSAGSGQLNGVGVGNCGCGCNGAGACGDHGACGCGVSGLGSISDDFAKISSDITSMNLLQAVQDPIFGVPVWAVAGALYLMLFMGGSQSHVSRARRAVKAY